MSYVSNFFQLNDQTYDHLYNMTPKFGYDGFGEVLYGRTYSRNLDSQEQWPDTVARVINGTFSIRKDWYVKSHLHWDEEYWQGIAELMAVSMFNMHWLPPGRGLWAMGTSFIYERGSMALYNCAATILGGNDRFSNDINWMMDCLMCGVGVGFKPVRDDFRAYKPVGTYRYIIGDTREEWAHATRLLINAFTKPGSKLPVFDYTQIRPAGLPIKGFGGKASGPGPLIVLHEFIVTCFNRFMTQMDYDVVRLKTDIANQVGCCVVAGNVRRSAEIAIGSMGDPVFKDLKDYERYPDRQAYGWMSNNSVALESDIDFESLGEIARRVVVRGEPGILNLKNFPYGRIGSKYPVRPDKATLINPCGEIPLEDKETCNICETFPTVCPTIEDWYNACAFGSLYCSTVSLLPTHRSETNRVVARNRRIGVGLVDYTNWVRRDGQHKVISYLRKGYNTVRETNRHVNEEAGVPEALRVTTVKPGGTVPKLPGKVSGAGYPTFNETLRRFSVPKNHPLCKVLDNANLPFELDRHDSNTRLYQFPIYQEGTPADQVSLWEQAVNVATLQAEWSDNAVSNTMYFKPKWKLVTANTDTADVKSCQLKYPSGSFESETNKVVFKNDYFTKELECYEYVFDPNHEEEIIEKVISAFVPRTKSLSLLPHSAKGAYKQMPEEGISREEYLARKNNLRPLDWSLFTDSDGADEKFCSGPSCELPGK